jgi:hypothetical protein
VILLTDPGGELAWHHAGLVVSQRRTQAQPWTVPLWLRGLYILSFVALVGSLFWLVMIWDLHQIHRRARHLSLKLSNTWDTYFRPRYVEAWESYREAECLNCGACCKILWCCPFLEIREDGDSFCTIHARRPIQCRTFPHNPHAVEYINYELPKEQCCSYRFAIKRGSRRRPPLGSHDQEHA